MLTSLDGKIMGKYMKTDEGSTANGVFYNIAFGKEPYYKHQGWLSGRITTDDNFTFYEEPDLDENAPIVPEGDFVSNPNAPMYYVSIDPSGKLGFKSNTLTYIDTTAHIIEVLTEKASNAYKAFLRKIGISYIIVGKDKLDYSDALDKLSKLFHIETLMLGGGAVLNWSFLQAGLCDELSLVVAPIADASDKTPALFSVKEGLTTDNPIGFKLEHLEKTEGDSIWLRYKVKNSNV